MNQQSSLIVFKFFINNFEIDHKCHIIIDNSNLTTLDLNEILLYQIDKDAVLKLMSIQFSRVIRDITIWQLELNDKIISSKTKLSAIIDTRAQTSNVIKVKIISEFTVILLLNKMKLFGFNSRRLNPNEEKQEFINEIISQYQQSNPKCPKVKYTDSKDQASLFSMLKIKTLRNLIKIPVVEASSNHNSDVCSYSTNYIPSCESITQEQVEIVDQNNQKFEMQLDYAWKLENLVDEIIGITNIEEIQNYAFECKQQNLLWFDPNTKLSELTLIPYNKIQIIEVGKGNYFRVSVVIGDLTLYKAITDQTRFEDFEKLILQYKNKSETSEKVIFFYKEKQLTHQQLAMRVSEIYDSQFKIKAKILKK